MYPSQFEYYRANSVEEAVSLLREHEGAKLIAGGHSLLPLMKLRLLEPPALIDVGGIQALKNVSQNGGLTIGAAATYRELLANNSIGGAYAGLMDAVALVGDVQVRNRGTLGGAIAHADPASDIPAVALAFNATVVAVGPNGERRIAADDFFVDVLTTALEEGEVVTQIEFPQPPSGSGSAYTKFEHPASGYAIVGVAAVVTLDGSGNISQASVGMTGAGPKAERLSSVESALQGKGADAVADACKNAAEGLDLSGDIHASAEYRGHLVSVFAQRAIEKAIERARG